MKKNLFEMGTDFGDDWSSDNKTKEVKHLSTEIKTPQKHQLHFAKENLRGIGVTSVITFCVEK
jgi:translation initiation factor 1